jgi:glycosyltransferase involved in cell wall biosynthesis
MPKLSVITVNLNNATGLGKTIKSVLNQTYKDFEYVIIDGGSTDESLEVLNTFSDRLTCWVSEKDNGIYNAMNKGILRATGEYCLFLNSGDYLINQEIFNKVFSFNFTEEIVSGAVIKYSDMNSKRSMLSKITSSEITLSDLFEVSLNHQATFIKRSLFTRYGLYDEKFKIISDWIFTLKTLVLNNVTFRYLDIVVTNYNTDGRSVSVSEYYASESLSGLKELIPPRILADYQTGYIPAVKRMKKYLFFWTIFRILNLCTIKYDSISQKIKTRRHFKSIIGE